MSSRIIQVQVIFNNNPKTLINVAKYLTDQDLSSEIGGAHAIYD